MTLEDLIRHNEAVRKRREAEVKAKKELEKKEKAEAKKSASKKTKKVEKVEEKKEEEKVEQEPIRKFLVSAEEEAKINETLVK